MVLLVLPESEKSLENDGLTVEWMLIFLQNSCVEILSPNGMVSRSGILGRWWGHESGDFMNEFSALVKETPENALNLFVMWEYNETLTVYNLEEDSHKN